MYVILSMFLLRRIFSLCLLVPFLLSYFLCCLQWHLGLRIENWELSVESSCTIISIHIYRSIRFSYISHPFGLLDEGMYIYILLFLYKSKYR